MKRLLFFISLCVSVLISASVYAQDAVPLRAKVLDGYARLVFEWPQNVSYTVERSSQNVVTLKFDKAGALDQSDAPFSDIKSIAMFDVVSDDPLEVALHIPRSSKIRDLKIGKRVILDVYDPEDATDLESLAKMEKPQAVVPKEVQPKTPEPEDKSTQVSKKDPPAAPPAIVLVPENLPPKKTIEQIQKEEAQKRQEEARLAMEKAKQDAIKKAVEQKEHIISLRGTQEMTLAAYESFGGLWVVVGGANAFSAPALTTPDPQNFPELQTVQDGVIDVYYLPVEERELYYKGIGGGLAWDLVMGDKVKPNSPVLPERILTSTDGLRSGTLFWPMDGVAEIVNIEEPETGQTLIVVTVENASQSAGSAQKYVDFDVLPSHIGLVIRPRVDDLEVNKTEGGVEITRPLGLALSLPKDLDAAELFENKVPKMAKSDVKKDVLLRFSEWQLGNHSSLKKKENILLAGIRGQTQSRRVQDLIRLGKMFISHARGAEAQGYFRFAVSEMPEIEESSELRAYRGVAKALSWKSREALEDFLFPGLDGNEEINLWKAFVLADLGDWQQAASLLPDKYAVLYTYPYNIASRMAVVLAEVNLRAGNVRKAEELMSYIDTQKEGELIPPLKAALQYLKGEAARQKKDIEQTKELWGELSEDKDDLYRTKASLALTILQSNLDEIKNEDVIDRLERLRYGWRGDGLEAQVNYWLGDAYFKAKDYIKGLVIMREAASMADESILAARITSDMAQTYNSMFKEENLKEVSPLDAVAVFDQFKELTPVGTEGDKLVQRLAEHLVRSNLMSRAAKLLQHQVDHRLNGKEKIRIAIRLAAIELLDKNPQKAINALGKANDTLNFISESEDKEQYKREIALLRIRAYAQNKEFKKALSLIENLPLDPIVNRLKADIAWKANYWDIAAEALNDVLIDENISTDGKLTKEQADIILNRAIALNLDNDRISLADMREKYSGLMLERNKDKARQFEVITRPRRTALLNDREALLSAVAEVDLFKEFLDSYRNIQN